MKYDYSGSMQSDPSKPWIFRPIVKLKISNGKNVISTIGHIDSGADLTLINLEYAEALGVDVSKCEIEKTVGIAGEPQEIYKTTLTFEVEHLDPITIPVFFIASKTVNCLLGQEGFFDSFRIKFEPDHKVVVLIPLKK